MIGGGEGSQIGPAHRLGAGLDGEFGLQPARSTTGPKPAATMASGWGFGPTVPMATGARCSTARRTRDDRVDLVTVATPNATHFEITKAFSKRAFTCCAKSR
jgi:hypothetical protein